MEIEVTATPSSDDREQVLSGLLAFNRAQASVTGERLAVLLRPRPGAAVRGGLIGHTYASWLHVELLWLAEELRGSGLGARLLREAETEARRRDCIGAHLDSYDFQAPGFYQRLGYEVFGVIDDHPPGHRRIFLRKRFDGRNAAPAATG